ncbi:hypothetical protein [Lysinibacillus sp. NPDC096212]|uniref:hypothetical protein n=1 Tax=Lysinibacillus sp. NPDC096212 TaxID=3364135 RepID=UPI00381D1E09
MNNNGHASANPIIEEFQTPSVKGDFSITGVGFKPRLLEFDVVLASVSSIQRCVSKITEKKSISHYSVQSGTISTASTSDGKAITLKDSNGAIVCECVLVAMNQDGFTLKFTEVTSRPFVMFTAYP